MQSKKSSIAADLELYKQWRHHLHANPELAFQESSTANFIIDRLTEFGIEVSTGLGNTGVVGTLRCGDGSRSIGLRSDMDALPIEEKNSFDYRSKTSGVMHACGHDGHIVVLLSAARHLATTKKFNGTVQFIFQPAEEANSIGSGAQAMIDSGLFEKFPMDMVFALHNNPLYPEGVIATRAGSLLASMDIFTVRVEGHGTHGAFPETGIDPIVISSAIINAWQTIVGRNVDPLKSAVISVTSIEAGSSFNVIPDNAVIKGSVRSLSEDVRKILKARLVELAVSIAEGFGGAVEVDYREEYQVTVNDPIATDMVCAIAESIVPEDRVISAADPVMGSDDFGAMLKVKRGCYFWLGSGRVDSISCGAVKSNQCQSKLTPCMLHEPMYDFNDTIIPVGAGLWVNLVEHYLSDDQTIKVG